MSQEQKFEIVISLLPLIPAMIKGVAGAVDAYEKLVDVLRDGVDGKEMETAIAERDAVFARIEAKALADAAKVGAG